MTTLPAFCRSLILSAMPGDSASSTEMATPWTSGRLMTSSIR